MYPPPKDFFDLFGYDWCSLGIMSNPTERAVYTGVQPHKVYGEYPGGLEIEDDVPEEAMRMFS